MKCVRYILFTQLEQQHDFLSRVYPSAYTYPIKKWDIMMMSVRPSSKFSSKVSISQVGHLAQAVIVFK